MDKDQQVAHAICPILSSSLIAHVWSVSLGPGWFMCYPSSGNDRAVSHITHGPLKAAQNSIALHACTTIGVVRSGSVRYTNMRSCRRDSGISSSSQLHRHAQFHATSILDHVVHHLPHATFGGQCNHVRILPKCSVRQTRHQLPPRSLQHFVVVHRYDLSHDTGPDDRHEVAWRHRRGLFR